MKCIGVACGSEATIELAYGGDVLGPACFACADVMMRALARENTRMGALVVESASGYQRWRAAVGQPCTADEAMEIARV